MSTGMVGKVDVDRHAIQARAKLRATLDEVELYLKAGWTKLSDEVRTKLDHLLEPDRS